MNECECVPKCPFFHDRMAEKPATANLMKAQFCQGDNSGCARYMVFKALGGSAVPADLFPSQAKRALDIISGGA